jgi:cystathionine beta-lyase
MSTHWTGTWRGLELGVERRELAGDGGSTLRLGRAGGPEEWLRFDCFDRSPHWHLDPSGRDEVQPLDDRGDIFAEVFERLETRGAELLEGAGADPATVAFFSNATGESDALIRLEAEQALRHRPARLEELDLRVLRSRRSEKWHTYPADVLPAWVAEMDFPVAAPIQAELERFVRSSDVGYPIGLKETGLADVFCERMQSRFGWRPESSRVEILSEVVQGMYLCLEAYCEAGQGVVVQTPIYPPFLGSIRETGRRLVENRMIQGEGGLQFDLEGLEASIDSETRLMLFCNPHNPSGRVFTRAELDRIAALAVEHDLIVVTDEIHADLLFDGRKHIPLATLGPEIAKRTVTLTSASKAFNIPGLRCAVAHFGSAELQRRFNTIVPRHIRGGIGLLGLYASMAAWRWSQPWLDEVVPYLQANRDFLEQALRERIPEIRFDRPEATYLAWLDCRELELPGSPAAHFMRLGQVALSDGRVFGEGWEDYARLNFATSRPILTDVIHRMAKALGR